MEIVALVVVGAVLVLLVGMFAWSGIRGVAGARVRGSIRDAGSLSLPHGLQVGLQEPQALRAAFALTGVGDVVDIGQSWLGAFRGRQLGLVDLHVRVEERQPPVAHTVVTLDVDQQWPWTRVRPLDAATVTVDGIDEQGLEGAPGGEAWVLDAADPQNVDGLVGPGLLAWLSRAQRPVVVEFTPRHLLVAAVGRVPDPDLAAFVELAVGVVDHVPPAARERWLPAPDGAEGAPGT